MAVNAGGAQTKVGLSANFCGSIWAVAFKKNPFPTSGRRYATFKSELMSKMPIIASWSASAAPIMSNHLLQDPPNGGRPIIDKEPIKKAIKVIGIARPKPVIWLILVLWVATYIEPAHIKSVILPMACMTTCKLPPSIPIEVARATPSVI